jgi:predicted Zn finger-like uncharacterized protein
MIITCPACAKRYLVEETAIQESGRQVQCISCQNEWFFRPISEKPKHNQVHLDIIGIKSSVARTNPSFSATWIFMVSTLIVFMAGGYFARNNIALHFPKTVKLFQIIGIPVELKTSKLMLENLKPYFLSNNQNNELVVTGEIFNNSEQVQQVPMLRITALGECTNAPVYEKVLAKVFKKNDGMCAVAKWTYTPPSFRLFPGEKLSFESRSERPLPGAKTVNIKF